MPTSPDLLSDAHLNRLREALIPGRREIDITPHELRSLLDEVEHHRIPQIDLDEPASRTRTIPTPDAALAAYRALVETHAADMPGAVEDWTFALGFFLGLGLNLETARHLSIRV